MKTLGLAIENSIAIFLRVPALIFGTQPVMSPAGKVLPLDFAFEEICHGTSISAFLILAA